MKYFVIAFLFCGFIVYGQAPELMNYQAVVRNSTGIPLAGGIKISARFLVHDSAATGTVIYSEEHEDTTNALGLINMHIGSANMATINWGGGAKFLQVLVNVDGANYVDMGTSQLVSVPYALFAANSTPGPPGPPGPGDSSGVQAPIQFRAITNQNNYTTTDVGDLGRLLSISRVYMVTDESQILTPPFYTYGPGYINFITALIFYGGEYVSIDFNNPK